MTAPHTLKHAIQYLEQAVERSHDVTSLDALRLVDPRKPCAAYGLARKTFLRAGTLSAAISDLQKELQKQEVA